MFPKALVWQGRGQGEASGVPLGPSPGPSGSVAEGRSAASGTLQKCCWCPQPVGRLMLTGGVFMSEDSLLFYKEFSD